jgi:predicted nucleic acid-binding protein
VSVVKVMVHTDVILDHLYGVRRPSVLRQAMSTFFCYTSVFQAVEIFSVARSPRERKAAEDAMSAMKLLGLNPKNAMHYGDLFAAHPRVRANVLLIAGLCLESKLPVLTGRTKEFKGIRGLTLIPTRLVGSGMSGTDIVNALQR